MRKNPGDRIQLKEVPQRLQKGICKVGGNYYI